MLSHMAAVDNHCICQIHYVVVCSSSIPVVLCDFKKTPQFINPLVKKLSVSPPLNFFSTFVTNLWSVFVWIYF